MILGKKEKILGEGRKRKSQSSFIRFKSRFNFFLTIEQIASPFAVVVLASVLLIVEWL